MQAFVKKSGWRAILALLGLCLAFAFKAEAQTNYLAWNNTNGYVNADIHGEALWPLLESISAQTGWHIFVEPGATTYASTKFQHLPAGDALKMLLGDLNFAFVPKANSPPYLYVFRTTMKNATRQVVDKKDARHVPNQLTLKVKPGTDMDALAKLLGAKIVGKLGTNGVYLLQFASANSTDAALADLQNNSDVQAVDYNYYYDQPPTAQQASSVASSPLSLPPPAQNSSGKVVVGLIDTSVNAQSLGANAAQFILPQINVDGGTPSGDGPTHGTAMAAQLLGTVASIENSQGAAGTSVEVQPINVYGSSGEQTTTYEVMEGLEAAANAGDSVINMSLGGSGDSTVLDQEVAQMTGEGYTIFAAAGNTPTGEPYYPAADSGVNPVTALINQPGPSAELASYANTWPDDPAMIALPGTGVFNYDGQSWEVQGTSTSTAEASGVYSAYASFGWAPTKIITGMEFKFPVPTL